MELPNVGKHCAHSECYQLDFLPLYCECGMLFCSDHFNLHIAECATKTSNNKPDKICKIENVYKCSKPGCLSTSIVPLICEKCLKHFCVVHRHIVECLPPDPNKVKEAKESYAVPVRQFNKAKVAVDKQVEKGIANAKKKEKNVELANKLQLMRIKNKAFGLTAIPVVDRIYFNIYLPGKCESTSPIFVSKNWSIGRAIDNIAELLKLQNNNNRNNALKLRLFRKYNGNILSMDLSVTLVSLLQENTITDGESLIMEYVTDDCTTLNVN